MQDTLGLKLPSLDTKPEKLKLDWPFQKKKKEKKNGFGVDLSLDKVGAHYNLSPNKKLFFEIDTDGNKCRGGFSVSF